MQTSDANQVYKQLELSHYWASWQPLGFHFMPFTYPVLGLFVGHRDVTFSLGGDPGEIAFNFS